MKKSSLSTTRTMLFGAAAFSALALASFAHAGSPMNLIIRNGDPSKPVIAKLMTDNANCVEGDTQLGEQRSINGSGEWAFTLYRRGGHGCDGKQGEFGVQFTPGGGATNNTIQYFDFDNNGSLELNRGYANAYPGVLSHDGGRNAWVYTTVAGPVVTAGPARGSWMLICQQLCNRTDSRTEVHQHTITTSTSDEVTHAVSVSLDAGISVEGVGSAGINYSTSDTKSISHAMAQAVVRREDHTDTRAYVFSPDDMHRLNIFALWQWIATTHLSTGEDVIVPSAMLTCTPDGRGPDYLPGTARDIGACTTDHSANH